MKFSFSCVSSIILSLLAGALSEVTVLKIVQIIYDKSPKLRIRGTGFDADDHDIVLEICASGQPSIKVDKDFLIYKDADGDGLILKLLGNRKWVEIKDRAPPVVALILSVVKFGADSTKNLLAEPVIVAQILSTPSVSEGNDVVYSSATNELRINGTGFIGAKKVDLYFQPSLVKEVTYLDVTKYPLVRDQVVLRLRHNYNWRDDSGPLTVVGIDTGGGPVKLNGDAGVKIVNVQPNLMAYSITVKPTADDQLIYHDEAYLIISGTGFNVIGNTLRFANGILGNNVNYTTLSTSDVSITLRIAPGSFWRKNIENLPSVLTLLAVNAGEGFVAVGPNNAGKGRNVAMVFERPTVFSDNKMLYRTYSYELHIKGRGFVDAESGYTTQLKFATPLVLDLDYTIRVVDRTDIEITLIDGRAWRADVGPLQLVTINTRGDDAGWVVLPGSGVHVAEVQEDIDGGGTDGVEVFPMGVKVYQSLLNQKIQITGTGFKEGMSFTFEPDLKERVDYDIEVASKDMVNLRLKADKKWRNEAGFIIAKSITVEKKTYNLADGEGIRVAIVLADPVVRASKDTYHESQSKLLVIRGTGFTNVANTKVIIRPIAPGYYRVLDVHEDTIRVLLKPDQRWLPPFMSLKDEDDTKRIAMKISSIDTGAGEVTFAEPITVGYIVKDREGVTCDDSCEFAFNGVCDDGTEPNDQHYHHNHHNNSKDDDLGGFYFYEPQNREAYVGVENEDYQVSACAEGTDCTDCGGVDALPDYSKPLDPASGLVSCTNTCIYPRDGVCDDPRGTKYCELGTDCQDCGPVGADNFTCSDGDDGKWDEDDDYWTFNDVAFLKQIQGLEVNRDKVKAYPREEYYSHGSFLVVLEGLVYTVGAVFLIAALYLLSRWYQNKSIPFLSECDEESNAQKQFELASTTRGVPLTPDVIHT